MIPGLEGATPAAPEPLQSDLSGHGEYQPQIQALMQLNDDMGNLRRSTNIGTIFFRYSLR